MFSQLEIKIKPWFVDPILFLQRELQLSSHLKPVQSNSLEVEMPAINSACFKSVGQAPEYNTK